MATDSDSVFDKKSIAGHAVDPATTLMSRRSMILGSSAAAAVLLGIPPAGLALSSEPLGSSHPDEKK